MKPTTRVLILDEPEEYGKVLWREMQGAHLCALRLKESGKFLLLKANKLPGKFTMSHFINPIGITTLNRYISANL